ncbi:MAG: hypothetical protein ACM3UZ_16435 [Acidobacteriota bacterium]
MARVKINDLKPDAKELNMQEMKNLFGGSLTAPLQSNSLTAATTGAPTLIELDSSMTKQENPGIAMKMEGTRVGIIGK